MGPDAQMSGYGDEMGWGKIKQLNWLVVWNINLFSISYMGLILPIDELIFFKMVIAPPTSQVFWSSVNSHGFFFVSCNSLILFDDFWAMVNGQLDLARVWNLQAGKAQNMYFSPRKANHAVVSMG